MKVHPNAIKIGNPTSQCALLGLKLVQLSTLAGRNAIKIGNPTSQCALLGLKLVQLSTLAGRIFFLSQVEKFGRSGDGVYTEYIQSEGAYKLHISSVRTPSEICPL